MCDDHVLLQLQETLVGSILLLLLALGHLLPEHLVDVLLVLLNSAFDLHLVVEVVFHVILDFIALHEVVGKPVLLVRLTVASRLLLNQRKALFFIRYTRSILRRKQTLTADAVVFTKYRLEVFV